MGAEFPIIESEFIALRANVMSEEAPTTIVFPPKTIASPRWGDMYIGKYADMTILKENEGYMIADRMNWWIPTETSWKCGPGKSWPMLERQQTGVGSKGEPIYSYTRMKKRPMHCLFGDVAEIGEDGCMALQSH